MDAVWYLGEIKMIDFTKMMKGLQQQHFTNEYAAGQHSSLTFSAQNAQTRLDVPRLDALLPRISSFTKFQLNALSDFSPNLTQDTLSVTLDVSMSTI